MEESKKNNVVPDTFQTVSAELETLMSLAPKEVKDRWKTEIDEKNEEKEELKEIEIIERDNKKIWEVLELVKVKKFSSKKAKEKERLLENRLLAEYSRVKKVREKSSKLYGEWIHAIMVACLVTVVALTVGMFFSVVGIIIAIILSFYFWEVVFEKKKDLIVIKEDQIIIKEIEKRFVIRNETVELKGKN